MNDETPDARDPQALPGAHEDARRDRRSDAERQGRRRASRSAAPGRRPTSATAEPTDRSKLRVTISMTALIAARLTIEVCSASRTKIALGEERAVGREVEEQPDGREHEQQHRIAQRPERRCQRCRGANGALLLSSEFVVMLGQPSVASPEQGSLRQILAGEFASLLAVAHHDDAIADVDQFLGVGRDDKEGAAALAQVEPDCDESRVARRRRRRASDRAG